MGVNVLLDGNRLNKSIEIVKFFSLVTEISFLFKYYNKPHLKDTN